MHFIIMMSLLIASYSAHGSTDVKSPISREKMNACLTQFADCSKESHPPIKDTLVSICETRRSKLKCDRLQKLATSEEKEKFFSCQNPQDLCSQMETEQSTLLYSCGAGVGGVFVDMVQGLILLPQTVYEIATKLNSLPSDYKSCSSDLNQKKMLLGPLKPKEMTDETIQRLSCGEIKKIIDQKVSVILSRLEDRRQQLATKTGNENVGVEDLQLSEQEIQALNYDLEHSGPLRKASCMKPQEAAELACRTMTQGVMTVGGAAGAAKLVKFLRGDGAKSIEAETLLSRDATVDSGVRKSRKPSNEAQIAADKVKYKEIKRQYHVEKTETQLNEMGVQYQRAQNYYINSKGEKVYLTEHYFSVDDPAQRLPNGGGELYRVKSIKKANGKSLSSPALNHAEMPALLKEIEARGYQLMVDSTLTFPGETTGGNFIRRAKIITVGPNVTWQTMKHEFDHLVFHQEIQPTFKSMRMQVQSQKNLENLLSDGAKKNYSAERIKEMEKLMKVGIEHHAIDERMATMKELEMMGWRRVTAEGMAVEKYGLEFTRDYLQSVRQYHRPLNAQEKATLEEVGSRIQTLDRRIPVASAIERNPAATAVGAGALVLSVFGSAMYYNNDGRVVFKDPKTGNWVSLKGKSK